MIPKAYREFERICAARSVTGSVLEVGSVPSQDSLLCMKSLEHASEKIGINLGAPAEYAGFHILQVNANDMRCFSD